MEDAQRASVADAYHRWPPRRRAQQAIELRFGRLIERRCWLVHSPTEPDFTIAERPNPGRVKALQIKALALRYFWDAGPLHSRLLEFLAS